MSTRPDDTLKMGLYRHYKGKFYLVVGLARHSETGELLVVYIPLYLPVGPSPLTAEQHRMAPMAVRPLEMFLEELPDPEGVVPRFEYVGEEVNLAWLNLARPRTEGQ